MRFLLIALLFLFCVSASGSEYDEIALNISVHIKNAGAALEQYEQTLKTENENSPGFAEALATHYYLKLLASNLILISTVVGAPRDMDPEKRNSYAAFVQGQLRLAINTSNSTIRLLKAGETSLPDNIPLRSSFNRFVDEIEEGQSFVGNFFFLHNQLQPGDDINVEIVE